jgi:hypothetical protein
MLGVPDGIPAKFLAQDGVIRITFGDTLPQQSLRASIRLRDLRSVRFVIRRRVFPEWKNILACLFRQRQCKLEDLFQRRFSHVSILSQN